MKLRPGFAPALLLAAPLALSFAILPTLAQVPNAAPATSDARLTGTWIAHWDSPMGGDEEIVLRLKSADGKITGSQSLPFGDSPVTSGQLTGDSFTLNVALEVFGNIQQRQITGKIVGDTLVLTPAMPGPPPGAGSPAPAQPNPAGPAPSGPPPMPPDAPAGPPPGAGPAGAGPSPRRMAIGPLTFHRGTPAPSFRAAPVDYAALPKVDLPAIQPVSANGLAQTPPMGWNSWNKFRTKIDDKTVRAIADAIVSSGMKDLGYLYVNIDDGWQDKRDADGNLSPNPNFPDMKALAAYVHSKGLKLGIYSSPGPTTCGGFTGSYGHEEQDAREFAAWGIDYLKYDWCSAARVWKDQDMQAVYQRMGQALQRTGRPIVYALCQYGRDQVENWGPAVGANLWRTTNDIRDRYDSMEQIGFAQSKLADAAGPGHWNDPDMLEIGNGGMSPDEYKTHFSLWAMAAAPLIAGNDVRNLTASPNDPIRSILLNKEVIAIDQDPLGKAGRQLPPAQSDPGPAAQPNIVTWTRPLASGDVAVALFNRGTAESPAAISLKALNLTGKHTVRDLWAHTDRGQIDTQFTTTVPAHGVVMIRISR